MQDGNFSYVIPSLLQKTCTLPPAQSFLQLQTHCNRFLSSAFQQMVMFLQPKCLSVSQNLCNFFSEGGHDRTYRGKTGILENNYKVKNTETSKHCGRLIVKFEGEEIRLNITLSQFDLINFKFAKD